MSVGGGVNTPIATDDTRGVEHDGQRPAALGTSLPQPGHFIAVNVS